MQSMTKQQKRALMAQVRFWAAHTLHWWVATLFVIITFTILYVFWGGDPAFAGAMLGQ